MFKNKSLCTVTTHKNSNKQQCNASKSLKHQYQFLKILGYFSLPNTDTELYQILTCSFPCILSSPKQKKQKTLMHNSHNIKEVHNHYIRYFYF